MKPKVRKRPATPLTFDPELGAAEAAVLCARLDAAMNAHDGCAMASLLSGGTRAHITGHAREFHESLRPIFAAFARSPSAEGLFRRFLPAALDPTRATGDEVAITQSEVTMQGVVVAMVKADRDMAEIFDAALRMLNPLVGATVEDVLVSLLGQMAEDLREVDAATTPLGSRVEDGRVILTVNALGPEGTPQVETWWVVREADGWRIAIDCTHCATTRAEYD